MNLDLIYNHVFDKNINSVNVNMVNHQIKLETFDNKYINQYINIGDKWKQHILEKYITLNLPKYTKNVLYLLSNVSNFIW